MDVVVMEETTDATVVTSFSLSCFFPASVAMAMASVVDVATMAAAVTAVASSLSFYSCAVDSATAAALSANCFREKSFCSVKATTCHRIKRPGSPGLFICARGISPRMT